MTKSKKRVLAVAISVAGVLAVFCTGYAFWAIGLPEELCMNIFDEGWEGTLSYSMLSSNLKEIISEEEFSDKSPQGRLSMYRKLENLTLDNRPTTDFKGSTSHFKSPYEEIIKIDNKHYYVDIQIDIDAGLLEPKVVNFKTAIFSSEAGA